MSILATITSKQHSIAVLIDPEKSDNGELLLDLLQKAAFANIDFIFIGGSTVTRSQFSATVDFIKENSLIYKTSKYIL